MYLTSALRFVLGVALFTVLGPLTGLLGWVLIMFVQQTPAQALQFFALAGLFAALIPAFISGLIFILLSLLVPKNAHGLTINIALGTIGALTAALSGWAYFSAFGFAQWFVLSLSSTSAIGGLLCSLVYSRWFFQKPSNIPLQADAPQAARP